ncbi:MAG: peptidylprolyl isomerase [Elusimicrobiota bacterium]
MNNAKQTQNKTQNQRRARIWFYLLPFIFYLLPAFIGCTKKSELILAKIDGEKITLEEFQKLLDNAPYQLQDYLATDTGRKQYLDAMVKEKMVSVAARKEGIAKRPAVKKQLAELEKRLKDNYEKLKNEIVVNELLKEKVILGDSDVSNYYEKHKEEFEKPTELKVSHILLATEDDAARLLTRLKKGEEFAKLAKEHSVDKMTAEKGGELGFFRKRQYVKEFEDAAFRLKKVGDISNIVKTPLGYHIIKLTDRKQLKPQKLEDSELEIKEILQKEKLDRYLDGLSKKYKPTINYELLVNPKLNG